MAFTGLNKQDEGLGRSRFRGRNGTISEMNIIPLVDVVLVLLIIFMLTASVMEFGLEVDVPKVRQVRDTAEELPVVTVTRDGALYLNENEANINGLAEQIRQRFQGAEAVYLRADKATVWDVPVQVLAELGKAGFKVNVVTQPEDETGRRR
jgi:biopolymer transport protein ExbD